MLSGHTRVSALGSQRASLDFAFPWASQTGRKGKVLRYVQVARAEGTWLTGEFSLTCSPAKGTLGEQPLRSPPPTTGICNIFGAKDLLWDSWGVPPLVLA